MSSCFTLLLAIVTALLFGIGPALAATRPAVVTTLKDEAGSVVGGGRQARVRRALVVAQVALSMLLLAGAGLFARSLFNLRSVDPGFPVESLLTFSIDPSLSGYDPSRTLALFEQAQDALGAVPGVRSASMSEIGAFTGNAWSMTVKVDGYQQKEDEDMNPNVDGIGPRYFATMGVPLVAGREFTAKDTAGRAQSRDHQRDHGEVFLSRRQPDRPAVRVWTRQAKRHRDRRRRQGPPHDAAEREALPRFVYIPYRQDEGVTELTFFVRRRRRRRRPRRAPCVRPCSGSIRTSRSST